MEKKSEEKLKFVSKIEEMTDKELKGRIKYGMEFEIPHKIRPVPYMGEVNEIVEYAFEELEARCPMTKIKDQYRVTIRFIPDKLIPELKSLKLYYWDFEECLVPISHEHLAAKIYKEFTDVIRPLSMYLRLDVAGRGEIFTTIRIGDYSLDKYPLREYKNL